MSKNCSVEMYSGSINNNQCISNSTPSGYTWKCPICHKDRYISVPCIGCNTDVSSLEEKMSSCHHYYVSYFIDEGKGKNCGAGHCFFKIKEGELDEESIREMKRQQEENLGKDKGGKILISIISITKIKCDCEKKDK